MDLSTVLHHHFHHQELGSQSDSQALETMITSSKPHQQQDLKKPPPPENEPQKCPRCESTNTKFCYYNNYSLSQPRYFCKSCRRYWTKGGTLRNVPVGGGYRRNKRPSSSSTSISSPSSTPSFSATSFIKRPHTHDVAAPTPTHNALFGGGLGLGFGFDTPQVNVTDFDGFLGHPHNGSFLINSIEQQNLCYGFGAPNEEMGVVPFEAAMKQESIESRGLWGLYPWQQMINNTNIGDNHGLINSMGFGGLSAANDLEPIRGLIANSAWQGNLLPSPALI